MKLIEKFYKNVIIKPRNSTDYHGGRCLLNDYHKDILIKDAYRLQFKYLYANLLILFTDSNLFIVEPDIINRLRKFINNEHKLSTNEILIEKNYIISLWSTALKENTVTFFDSFYQYMTQLFNELIDTNNWLYVDTDQIWFINEPNLLIDNIPLIEFHNYTLQKIDYSIFIARKKYMYSIDKNIKTVGMSLKNQKLSSKDDKYKHFRSLIETEIRNDKIEELTNGLS